MKAALSPKVMALAVDGRCRRYTQSKPVPCGRVGVAVQQACVHEHMRNTFVCELHMNMPTGCGVCFDVDGHFCPLDLTRIAEAAS